MQGNSDPFSVPFLNNPIFVCYDKKRDSFCLHKKVLNSSTKHSLTVDDPFLLPTALLTTMSDYLLFWLYFLSYRPKAKEKYKKK